MDLHVRPILGDALLAIASVALVGPSATAFDDQPTRRRQVAIEPVTITATVKEVNQPDKVLVLQTDDGTEHTLYLGDDVSRLSKVKAGDVLRATYRASVATRLLKPGETATAGTAGGATFVGARAKPAALLANEVRAVVLVTRVDPVAQIVTVKNASGRELALAVEDRAALATVKAGDRLEVVFTEAALISAESAPK